MRILKIALLLATLTLSGCITVGGEFPHDKLNMLQPGTSKQEVQRVFGEPWRVGRDGIYRTWTYAHYDISVFGEPKTRDLVIRFDTADKVVSFTFNSTYREDENL